MVLLPLLCEKGNWGSANFSNFVHQTGRIPAQTSHATQSVQRLYCHMFITVTNWTQLKLPSLRGCSNNYTSEWWIDTFKIYSKVQWQMQYQENFIWSPLLGLKPSSSTSGYVTWGKARRSSDPQLPLAGVQWGIKLPFLGSLQVCGESQMETDVEAFHLNRSLCRHEGVGSCFQGYKRAWLHAGDSQGSGRPSAVNIVTGPEFKTPTPLAFQTHERILLAL